MFQKNTLRDELTRVAASDPSLTELDLSGSTRFLSLTPVQKGQAIGLLAQGRKLETLVLNSLRLDNTSSGALAEMLRQNTTLTSVSLEGNNLTEEGLVAIAAGVATMTQKHMHMSRASRTSQASAMQDTENTKGRTTGRLLSQLL